MKHVSDVIEENMAEGMAGAGENEGLPAKVYAVTSGKGGVGKTSLALNTAIILSKMGMKVLLIDADIGLANIDIMLGITTAYTIEDVLHEKVDIFDTIVEGPHGLSVLPAASAIGPIGQMTDSERLVFQNHLSRLEEKFHYIFIDTGAGISSQVINFVFMAREVVVVMTPEPTAITDAYAMVKIITMTANSLPVGIIINWAKSPTEAEQLYDKFQKITERFLGLPIINRGYILIDEKAARAVMMQVPLVLAFPKSPASRCLIRIAKDIVNSPVGSDAHERKVINGRSGS